jgi:hypothetical protein
MTQFFSNYYWYCFFSWTGPPRQAAGIDQSRGREQTPRLFFGLPSKQGNNPKEKKP